MVSTALWSLGWVLPDWNDRNVWERRFPLIPPGSSCNSRMWTKTVFVVHTTMLSIWMEGEKWCSGMRIILTSLPVHQQVIISGYSPVLMRGPGSYSFIFFRRMVCCSLIELELWKRDAVERYMSHMERKAIPTAAAVESRSYIDLSVNTAWMWLLLQKLNDWPIRSLLFSDE